MTGRPVTVIVTAAGRGSRFGAREPKQFLPLGGKPVLAHTLALFDGMERVNRIVLTVPEDYIAKTRQEIVEAYPFRKVTDILPGGSDRQDSVYHALRRLPEDTDIVLIHDGVRPLTAPRTIMDVIAYAEEGYAAIAGVKSTDTIKLAGADGLVYATPDRAGVWAAQTPQGFAYRTVLEAHRAAAEEGFTGTDDAMLVERYRLAPVKMVDGGPGNIKITNAHDLAAAEELLGRNIT